MKSRTENSIKNIAFGFGSQIIVSVFTFLTRSVFIYCLGNTYLGLNGLFSDLLSLLSLAELGFGTAIIYSMYKPIAYNDEKTISALLNLYKRIYITIGIIITITGLVLTPFLHLIISDLPPMKELPLIYIMFLLNTSLSYFWSYKKSILIADQKVFVTSLIQTIFIFSQNILQILVLIISKDYILFLSVMLTCTIATNIIISRYVDKKYEYLKKYRKEKISKECKDEIKKNVKGMFISKVSSVIVTSTDNILISKYISTILLGYYSNYTLFVNLLRQLISKIFEALTGSIGNLLAQENSDKAYETFSKIWFINFWLVGFSCVGLFSVVNTFISWWIGEKYLLNNIIVFFICLNLYMRLIRNTLITYIDAYGLFYKIKWKCIGEAISNIVFSLIYIKIFKLGIIGVLLGTFTSNIITNFWFEPYLLYKIKFKVELSDYFRKFVTYFICTLFSGIIIYHIGKNITFTNLLLSMISQVVICTIIFNLLFILIFFRTEEFKYMIGLIKKILRG